MLYDRNTKTVKEISQMFEESKLIIDDSYQRRKVWVARDNIRLIETILLELIIPEIYLWDSSVDPETGNTIKHIVDGQQRISAIVDFVSNDGYKLTKSSLKENNSKEKYGNLMFKDLPPDVKSKFWAYKLPIIEIDKNCSKETIKKMFERLNLTEYSLNSQEKRNSLTSKFGYVSKILANNPFWAKHKIFSPARIRRMLDVEYCSSLLILAREGIIDQGNQNRLNQIYDDLKEVYKDKNKDMKLVQQAMNLAELFFNPTTTSFIVKQTQLYSLFSLIFDLINNDITISTEIVNKFTTFVSVYNLYRNGFDIQFDSKDLTYLFDSIKRYKLASSEGLNKISNRMIRFEVLKKICLSTDCDITKHLNIIKNKMTH